MTFFCIGLFASIFIELTQFFLSNSDNSGQTGFVPPSVADDISIRVIHKKNVGLNNLLIYSDEFQMSLVSLFGFDTNITNIAG